MERAQAPLEALNIKVCWTSSANEPRFGGVAPKGTTAGPRTQYRVVSQAPNTRPWKSQTSTSPTHLIFMSDRRIPVLDVAHRNTGHAGCTPDPIMLRCRMGPDWPRYSPRNGPTPSAKPLVGRLTVPTSNEDFEEPVARDGTPEPQQRPKTSSSPYQLIKSRSAPLRRSLVKEGGSRAGSFVDIEQPLVDKFIHS